MLGPPAPAAIPIFCAKLQEWFGTEPHAAAAALEEATSRAWNRPLSAAEKRDMAAWFGEDPQTQTDTGPSTLAQVGEKATTTDRLQLYALVVAMAAAPEGLQAPQLRILEEVARVLRVDPVVSAAIIRRQDPRYRSGLILPLDRDPIVLGSAASCDLVLPDPQVLPRHARLQRAREGWRVVGLGQGRPLRVNGEVVGSAPVMDGSVLQLGPAELHLESGGLRLENRRDFSALSARKLSRKIGDLPVLQEVSFTALAGEVIAIVGPSGGGKTTLLQALQGTTPADQGWVELDGADFHQQLVHKPSLAGDVPQDDLVLPELTVQETLEAAAELRFANDRAQRDRAVERVLRELDLGHIRYSRIGDALRRGISGGQRKRINLGQELLGEDTRVLFLDEPTSGLDPQASQDILQKVRQLADQGRIVFLVTHDLSAEIVAQVDHLLVLARGGHLAFFGPPSEACAWFSVGTPDAIFHRLKDHPPAEWAARYRQSEVARMWGETRSAAVDLGFLGRAPGGKAELAPTPRPGPLRQLRTLVQRYTKTKLRDSTGLLILAAQPPVLAGGLVVLYPGVAAGSIFILTLSCMWFGMSAAVRELIADRVLWRRERRLGLGVGPYLGSKVLVLGTITALQCLVMLGLCWGPNHYADNGFDPASLLLVCTLTGWAGMGLALVVSALWNSSEAAVGSLPILLVPQILFSSILVSLRSMDPFSKALSYLTLQRYALDAALKSGKQVQQASTWSSEWEKRELNGALYQLGLKPENPDDAGLPWGQLVGALGAWATLFLGLATLLIWSKGRPRR